MMKERNLAGRFVVAGLLVGMLFLLTSAPAFPAQPETGTVATGSGVQVWNGHGCAASVPVTITALSTGLGGYETKLGWDPARFSSASADVTIDIGTYLTNGGTRQQTGAGGTPALKIMSSGAVKYGAYSWSTGSAPGNQANGQLATVSIRPTGTCGSAALTVTETQLVDINANVISLTAQTGSSVAVFSRYDVNGVQSVINTGDVNAVVGALGASTTGCDANYRFNTNLVQSVINSGDVNAVVGKLGQLTTNVCVN